MNLLNFFCLFTYIGIIFSNPIELKCFTNIELPKGTSEYIYHYSFSTNNIPKISEFPFIYLYLKISNYKKLKNNILININPRFKEEENYELIIPEKNEQWISFKNYYWEENISIKFQINTIEKNLKMIFFDSSKIIDINIKQFLNLNFITGVFNEKIFPLIFNIKADSNSFFSVQKQENYQIFNGTHILGYCRIEENNNCHFIETDNIQLIKNNNYRFKLNYYFDKRKKYPEYFFQKYEINYYIEEIYIKNNSYVINDFTKNNYLLLNLQNYTNISYYTNDNSGRFYQRHKMRTITKDEWSHWSKYINDVDINKYENIKNGEIADVNISSNDEYIIIRLDDKNKIKRNGFILFFNESYEINGISGINWSKKINKGSQCLIKIKTDFKYTGVLTSSNNNMKQLFKSKDDNFTNKIILNKILESIVYIYINSTGEETIFNCKFYEINNEFYSYKLLTDDDISHTLNKYKSDYFFIRKIYNKEKIDFFSYYFFDIQEQYYIYIKKYFGTFDLYKYKKHLDLYSDIDDFLKPISYYDEEIYEKVNNKLLILSGTQFFNYYINYGASFDFYIQKVNDYNYIDINQEMNIYGRSTIKLINAKKNYYIKFELNHLIKLNNNFLEAEVTFRNKYGTKYILNNKNKIINLKGNGFSLESNKLALIYFYEKIENIKKSTILEFDKNKKGKNMRINITNNNNTDIKIAIAKDFGFGDCYPIMDLNSLEIYTIPKKQQ